MFRRKIVSVIPVLAVFMLTAPVGKAQRIPRGPLPGAGMGLEELLPSPGGKTVSLRLELARKMDEKGRLVLRLRGPAARRRDLRRTSVLVFRPEGGAPVVLRDVRWRGRRIELRLPAELRGRPGSFYLAPAGDPGRAISALVPFRPARPAPGPGTPGPIARPGLPIPGPGGPEPTPGIPPRPLPTPGQPGAGGRGLPIPEPMPFPRPGRDEVAMRLDRVVHVSGREVYPYRSADDLRPYSPASLARCLALDPGGDTVVALQGRGFGRTPEGRRVRLTSARGRRAYDLPVERWSETEIRVRIPAAVEDAIFGPGVVAVAPHRFEIVGRDGRVLRGREAEFCERAFTLTVTYVIENCPRFDPGSLPPPRIDGQDVAPIPTGTERRGTPERRIVVRRYRILEGRQLRVFAPDLPEGVCRHGAWQQREVMVGPALHGDATLTAEFRHRTEPVEFSVPVALLQAVVNTGLRLSVRIHNWAGNRVIPEENASWVRTAAGEYRFTLPRFYAELGGFLDPAVPDLISFVNDINSERVTVRLSPAGRNLALRIEARFESEGVEVKNYANTGSEDVGDDLYPDAHLDNGRVVVEGLAIGWDRERSAPGIVGSPRVGVDLAFDLRGLGELIEPFRDFEGEIESAVSRAVARALSRPDVQDALDRVVLRAVEDGIRSASLPPVGRYLDARVEERGGSPVFVVRYLPEG